METIDGTTTGAAIIMAVIFGVAVRSWLIASMSNVAPASEARGYLEENTVNITVREDRYLYTRVHRTPKNRKDDD